MNTCAGCQRKQTGGRLIKREPRTAMRSHVQGSRKRILRPDVLIFKGQRRVYRNLTRARNVAFAVKRFGGQFQRL
jgi:hypothetical protein